MSNENTIGDPNPGDWWKSWGIALYYPIRNAHALFFPLALVVINWAMRSAYLFSVMALFGVGLVLLLTMSNAIDSGSRNEELGSFSGTAEMDWEKGAQVLVQSVVLILVCFGPTALIYWTEFSSETWKCIYLLCSITIGAAYLPIPLLAISLFETFGVLSPAFVVRSILRAPGPSLFCSITFILVHSPILLEVFGWSNLIRIVDWASGTGVVFGSVYLYLLNVWCRSLGHIYWFEQHRLKWG